MFFSLFSSYFSRITLFIPPYALLITFPVVIVRFSRTIQSFIFCARLSTPYALRFSPYALLFSPYAFSITPVLSVADTQKSSDPFYPSISLLQKKHFLSESAVIGFQSYKVNTCGYLISGVIHTIPRDERRA